MQKGWYVLLACVIVSCTPPKKQEEKENVVAQESMAAPATPGIAPISLDEAATYIANFINHPAYGNLARNVALGGAFTKAAFEVPADQGGVAFWYCQNNTDKAYPEFFLALDHLPGYDSTAIPTSPAADVVAPDYTFTYTEEKGDPQTVKHYLETLQIDNQIEIKPLAKVKADAMIKEFQNLVARIGNCATDNCKYPLGYFDGKAGDYLNTFLAKNPAMVRYFFGYDTGYGGNSIRIILIGSNDQGANILSLTASEGAILQKSVPPPPIN